MTEPPYNDTDACPACPSVVRNLGAAAHNAVSAWKAAVKGMDEGRAHRKMHELARAVESWQVVVDAHFADPMHSHGYPATETR